MTSNFSEDYKALVSDAKSSANYNDLNWQMHVLTSAVLLLTLETRKTNMLLSEYIGALNDNT